MMDLVMRRVMKGHGMKLTCLAQKMEMSLDGMCWISWEAQRTDMLLFAEKLIMMKELGMKSTLWAAVMMESNNGMTLMY